MYNGGTSMHNRWMRSSFSCRHQVERFGCCSACAVCNAALVHYTALDWLTRMTSVYCALHRSKNWMSQVTRLNSRVVTVEEYSATYKEVLSGEACFRNTTIWAQRHSQMDKIQSLPVSETNTNRTLMFEVAPVNPDTQGAVRA